MSSLLLLFLLLPLSSSSLVLLLHFFRNSARYPVYPISKWKNSSLLGELTPIGLRQQYILGANTKKNYNLERIGRISAFATNHNRSIVSAFAHLMGLQPAKRSKKEEIGGRRALEEKKGKEFYYEAMDPDMNSYFTSNANEKDLKIEYDRENIVKESMGFSLNDNFFFRNLGKNFLEQNRVEKTNRHISPNENIYNDLEQNVFSYKDEGRILKESFDPYFEQEVINFDNSDLEVGGESTQTPIENREDLLLKGVRCKGFGILREEGRKEAKGEDIQVKYAKEFDSLRKIMKLPKMDYDKFYQVVDGLQSDLYLNNKLPSEIDLEFWQKIKYLYALYFPTRFFPNQKTINFANTLYFEEIISQMEDAIKEKSIKNVEKKEETTTTISDPNVILYSVHDINLSHLMLGLNITSLDCLMKNEKNEKELNCVTDFPIFASSLMLELHLNEIKGSYFVRVSYNGVPMNLSFPNSTECEYEEFKNKLKATTMNDFNDICFSEKIISKSIFNLDYTKKLMIYLVAIFETTLLLLLCLIFFKMKQVKFDHNSSLHQIFEMNIYQHPNEEIKK